MNDIDMMKFAIEKTIKDHERFEELAKEEEDSQNTEGANK